MRPWSVPSLVPHGFEENILLNRDLDNYRNVFVYLAIFTKLTYGGMVAGMVADESEKYQVRVLFLRHHQPGSAANKCQFNTFTKSTTIEGNAYLDFMIFLFLRLMKPDPVTA